MHKKNPFWFPVAVALLAVTAKAVALPYSAFDPRSLAMGGTGVASATSGNASFYNPALLAAPTEGDHFSLAFPVVKASIADPDNLIQSARDFNDGDYINAFSNALNTYNLSPTTANKDAVVTSAENLVSGLQSLSDKALQGDGDAALVIGMPRKNRLAAALFVSTEVIGGGVGHVSAQDIAALNNIVTALSSATPPANLADPTNQFTSSVEARFAVVGEVGLSLARKFSFKGHSIVVGVTPKYLRVQTYDYLFKGVNLDNARISLNQGKSVDSSLDMDFGLAKDFGHGWRGGFAVKNLFGQKYATALGHTIFVNPQARIGVLKANRWATVAMDFDLTENDPVGFDSKTRYLGAGAEFNAWHVAKVRVGYRFNIADTATSIATGGLGFSPFGVLLDLAIAGNAHEIAAAVQTGFHF